MLLGARPSVSFTRRSTSSTRVRTWRALRPAVTTNASTAPNSSPMASTTVSWPNLSSATTAAAIAPAGIVGSSLRAGAPRSPAPARPAPRPPSARTAPAGPLTGPSMEHVQGDDGGSQGRPEHRQAERRVAAPDPSGLESLGPQLGPAGRPGRRTDLDPGAFGQG